VSNFEILILSLTLFGIGGGIFAVYEIFKIKKKYENKTEKGKTV